MADNDSEGDGRLVTVDIAGPAHGGTCVARIDGQVVFVRGSLPGESGVQVAIDEPGQRKQRFLTGTAISIAQPHQHRIAQQCRAAAVGGGCCDLDFVQPEGSIAYKRQVVVEQFQRLSGLPNEELERIEALAESMMLRPSLGWRDTARLGLGLDDSRTLCLGVRKRGSRQIVSANDASCAQWSAELKAAIEQITAEISTLLTAQGIEPQAAIAAQADVIISVPQGGNIDEPATAILRTTTQRRNPRRRSSKPAARTAGATSIPPRVVLRGSGLTRRILELQEEISWDIPADAFWQGHSQATQTYVDWVRRHVPAPVSQVEAWDLYGGAGVFAAGLQSVDIEKVFSVDTASAATAVGQRTLPSVQFVDGLAEDFVATHTPQLPLHAVVLDPPRSGAGAAVIQHVAEHSPNHVVHIGCDPATAARDIGLWWDAGYQVEACMVVDAFPLTHHVEVLVYLRPRVHHRVW